MVATIFNASPPMSPTIPADSPRRGTQSIERVVGMLRVVASRGRNGMRLGDVATASGLPTSTCFRMLQRLEVEGLVERHPVTRKYFLGPLLHELGLLARPRVQLAAHCEPVLAEIADATKDTVDLSGRRGLEAVCTARALGDYPIKALTLDVGIRRPLGVDAGGLAILCALPPDEAGEIIDANARRCDKLSALDPARVRAAVDEGRAGLCLSGQRGGGRHRRRRRGLAGRQPDCGGQRGGDLVQAGCGTAGGGGCGAAAAGFEVDAHAGGVEHGCWRVATCVVVVVLFHAASGATRPGPWGRS